MNLRDSSINIFYYWQADAKRDLMREIEEEREKMKKYNTTESFLDPNINGYIESLQAIIQKAKESMNKIDRDDYINS